MIKKPYPAFIRFFLLVCRNGCLILCYTAAGAQEQPPRPMSVTLFQDISFGAIIQGNNGGSVTIFPDGSRTVSGDIFAIDLGVQYSPAIFEVEATPGTLVTIVFGPDTYLTGNNGGSMSLHIGTSDPLSPFINTLQPPGRTQVCIGGTLTVGNPLANSAGDYAGLFSVIFIQE